MKGLRYYFFVRHRDNWRLLTRFSVVGGTGVVVNLLVFGLLLGTGIDPHGVVLPIAGTEFNVRWYHGFSTVAFLLANLWNFELNRRWTFKSANCAPWLTEYGPFLAVGLAAQVLGLLVLTMLLHPRSPVSLPIGLLDGSSLVRSRELWAQAMTIGIVTPVSFIGNKLWTFRAVRSVPPLGPRHAGWGVKPCEEPSPGNLPTDQGTPDS
jgi:putative flippase GtrA